MGHFPGGSSKHLVDREAIDYEAAAKVLNYYAADLDFDVVTKIVDAALGVTDGET